MNDLATQWQWLIAAMTVFTVLGYVWLLWSQFADRHAGPRHARSKRKEKHA